jgi:hypothetical protein
VNSGGIVRSGEGKRKLLCGGVGVGIVTGGVVVSLRFFVDDPKGVESGGAVMRVTAVASGEVPVERF